MQLHFYFRHISILFSLIILVKVKSWHKGNAATAQEQSIVEIFTEMKAFQLSGMTVEDVVQNALEIKTYHRHAPGVAFDFLREESQSTIKLFFIMLTILDVIKNNKVE